VTGGQRRKIHHEAVKDPKKSKSETDASAVRERQREEREGEPERPGKQRVRRPNEFWIASS